ncbi:expressed unknown protein [Seminavis robusta]|uniref:BTB domain-containing protein n=1 Tax=Seminavis robusta TaxID=568900 RepID=A0A9N8HCH7_9STRA|nr:expressed unknown protein [Seminavis robusta]|eukprot:Sro319_g116320.1 n/a (280) ;mRNA; r:53355-54194
MRKGQQSTSTNNNNDEYHPELVQIHKTTLETLSSLSSDGADLISFKEDGTCVTELSSRPPSATSFLLDEEKDKQESKKNHHKPGLPFRGLSEENSKRFNKSVYVMVSGTSFSVPREAFAKMEKLNWTRDESGVAHLETSPAIFEVLLGHLVFDSLPAYDTLSKKEYEEFEPMALTMGLYELIEHFDRSSDKRLRSTRGGRRSLLKKKSSSTSGSNGGKPIVLNSENTNVASMKLMAANSSISSCARFVASWKRKSTGKLRRRRSKATHDQLCSASDHVN